LSSQREEIPCICGGVFVVVARLRAASVLRDWRADAGAASSVTVPAAVGSIVTGGSSFVSAFGVCCERRTHTAKIRRAPLRAAH